MPCSYPLPESTTHSGSDTPTEQPQDSTVAHYVSSQVQALNPGLQSEQLPKTLDAALEEWLQLKIARRGLRPRTVRAYRADIATFAAHFIGDDPCRNRNAAKRVLLQDLSTDAVVCALRAIRLTGAAEKTRERLHGTLSGLFSYLFQQGELATNIAAAISWKRPKVAPRVPRYIKPSEIAKVIATAATVDIKQRDPWPERHFALASLLASTAAHPGEICSLLMGDVVLDGEEPHVRVGGNSSVARDCPISDELVAILRSYLASRKARTGKICRKEDIIFLNSRLDPLNPATLDYYIRRWFARADVTLPPGAAAHVFRHTVAMQLIDLGESMTVVQELLGHASPSSTQIYAKAVDGRAIAVAGERSGEDGDDHTAIFEPMPRLCRGHRELEVFEKDQNKS